jgi:hypothetical protein
MNRTIATVALFGLLVGCRGKEREAASGFMVFQLSTASPSLQMANSRAVVAIGPDTVFLERVRMVLSELAIAPSLANECEEEEGEDNPPCVEFDEDPVLIELPLDRPVERRSMRPAPATEFNLFQAIIHRPEPDADTALLRANPEFNGRSVLVEGIWSRRGIRTPFSLASDFAEQEEISLEPALSVSPADSLKLTFRVDVATWFRSEDGKSLVDPRTAGPGGPNEHLLKDHIRTSIAVFRDQNGDGRDDAATP